MWKRGRRRVAAMCLLLAMLILEGLAGRSSLFDGVGGADLTASQPGGAPAASSLGQEELNALVEYEALLSAEAPVASHPPVGPNADPSARALRQRCAQAIDTAYPLLPLPNGQMTFALPSSAIIDSEGARTEVDEPCLLYLAHELLFDSRSSSRPDPPSAAGSPAPQATSRPGLPALPVRGQQD